MDTMLFRIIKILVDFIIIIIFYFYFYFSFCDDSHSKQKQVLRECEVPSRNSIIFFTVLWKKEKNNDF